MTRTGSEWKGLFFKKHHSEDPGEKATDASAVVVPASAAPVPAPALSDAFVPAHAVIPQKRSLKWLKVLLIVFVAALAVTYGGFAVFFLGHFGFNSTVNGVDVSFKTVEEAEAIIASQVDDYSLSIVARAGQTAGIQGSQVDLEYVPDGQVPELLEGQNVLLWPARLFSRDDGFTHASVTLDNDKLNAVVDGLPLLDVTQMKPPIDACLIFTEGAYRIQPEDPGTTLDVPRTKQLIIEAVLATTPQLDLDAAGAYLVPKVGTNDSVLAQNRDRFNTYVPFSITYVLGNDRVVLDGNTTINWVDTSGAGPGQLDYDSVAAWVASFAAQHDTVGATRVFTNGYGDQKTVSGGTYGWLVDQDAEIDAIFDAAANRRGEEREPYLLRSAASLGVPDWGTTYAEVDMSEQHMWYFVNGELVLDCDVVTGLPSGGNNTPEGVYTIIDRKSPTVLRGPKLPSGEYEWESPVTYWMAITVEGVGFHDATWQPAFGGQLYLYRGSHGCVNMPYAVAQELYSLIEMGTPVVLHY